MDILYEHELYLPVRELFEADGYEVRAEVNGCDAVAMREDDIVIIELKLRMNLEVLLQACDRQKLSELVYIAIPFRKKSGAMKNYAGVARLLRRLGIGLIVVRAKNGGLVAEITEHAAGTERPLRKSARKSNLLKEFSARHGDFNTGGVTGTPIVTAYRECVLLTAALLSRHGEATPKQLIALGAGEKTSSILQKNYYGWFERTERRGVYRLTAEGARAVERNAELIEMLL